jgi:hypothetical protein
MPLDDQLVGHLACDQSLSERMRLLQKECRTIVVVPSVLTNTPLLCASAQWTTQRMQPVE